MVLVGEFVAKFNPPQDEVLLISQATRDKSERMKRLQNQQLQQQQDHQQPHVLHSATGPTFVASQRSQPWHQQQVRPKILCRKITAVDN